MARVLIGNVRPSIDEMREYFAPAGYGIGEDIKQYVTLEELDNTFVNGLYWVTCIGNSVDGQTFNYALARVSGNGSTHCIQELLPLGLDKVLIRRCYEGSWEDWDQLAWKSYVDKNFAPAGYGLGEAAPIITDLDTAKACGWYNFGEGSNNSPFQYGGALLVLSKGTSFIQLAFNVVTEDWGGAGGIARRIGGETWHEWEYINPPMLAGSEYRTTERFLGKPVYTKLVDCGSMPSANAIKTIDHGVENVGYIVDFGGSMKPDEGNSISLPYRYSDENYAHLCVDSIKVQLESGATDLVAYTNVYVWFKYTKSTD